MYLSGTNFRYSIYYIIVHIVILNAVNIPILSESANNILVFFIVTSYTSDHNIMIMCYKYPRR